MTLSCNARDSLTTSLCRCCRSTFSCGDQILVIEGISLISFCHEVYICVQSHSEARDGL